MTADEISFLPPAEWSKEVWALFHQALPDPDDSTVFNRLMTAASSRGLPYVDALIYVIEERRKDLRSSLEEERFAAGTLDG